MESICPLFDGGFGPEEVVGICSVVDKLVEDQEFELDFAVGRQGNSGIIRLVIFAAMDNSFDLFFFASQEVAAEIEEKISQFAN